MKTVIEMAREAGLFTHKEVRPELERFAELVRADERNRTWTQEHWTEYEHSIVAAERNSWPAEMEAMERQVNILTDALNDRQRWFDALEAQHKQAILAERDACANLAQKTVCDVHIPTGVKIYGTAAAKAIRARSNT